MKKAGIFYAFSDQQFNENKTYKDAPDSEYLSVGAGAYIHKQDKPKLDKFLKYDKEHMKKDFLNKIKMEDFIEYELSNHECYYTGDLWEIAYLMASYYDKNVGDMYKKVQDVYNVTKQNYMSI